MALRHLLAFSEPPNAFVEYVDKSGRLFLRDERVLRRTPPIAHLHFIQPFNGKEQHPSFTRYAIVKRAGGCLSFSAYRGPTQTDIYADFIMHIKTFFIMHTLFLIHHKKHDLEWQ